MGASQKPNSTISLLYRRIPRCRDSSLSLSTDKYTLYTMAWLDQTAERRQMGSRYLYELSAATEQFALSEAS